ncbi:unnamed protein product, partial [Polarella glacialis]
MPPKMKGKAKAVARKGPSAATGSSLRAAAPVSQSEPEVEEDVGDGSEEPEDADVAFGDPQASSGKRSREEGEAKTTAPDELDLNVEDMVDKAYQESSFAEIAAASVSALSGIGPKAKKAFGKLHIKSVQDLASWKFYKVASTIASSAERERDGQTVESGGLILQQALDKAHASKSLQLVLELKPSALSGLAPSSDKVLAELKVRTIAQLAGWKYARWAEHITGLAKREEALLGPSSAASGQVEDKGGGEEVEDVEEEDIGDGKEGELDALFAPEADETVAQSPQKRLRQPTESPQKRLRQMTDSPQKPTTGGSMEVDLEGDLWNELDRNLEVSLDDVPEKVAPADISDSPGAGPPALPISGAATQAEESDDDNWGMDWKGDGGVDEDLIKKITSQAKKALGWEKEEWPADKEKAWDDANDEDQDGEEFWTRNKADMYNTQEESAADADTWLPDEEWGGLEANSQEGMAARAIVQKIRARAARDGTTNKFLEDTKSFPKEAVMEVWRMQISLQSEVQRMMLAAMLWLEANTLEVKEVPSDLNNAALNLIGREEATIRALCTRVPRHVLLKKANTKIPPKELRAEAAKVTTELVEALQAKLESDFHPEEKSDDMVQSLLDEVMANQPATVRIMAL